jgi:acyl carrier protein
MHTKEVFYQVFSKAFEVPVETVHDELAYQEIAEWDSMSHLVLVTELETQYGVSIDMEDILEMGSVSKIAAIMRKYDVNIQ